jgi:hypothetical protein
MQMEEPSSTQFPRVRAARWAVGIAFGLGLAFELLFDGHVPGISIPLWVGLCVAGLLLAARFERAHLSLQGAIWPVVVLALALVFPFRLEPLTIGLAVVLGLIALTIWVDTLLPGDLLRFGWVDLLRSTLVTPLLMLIRPWAVLGDAWRRSVREDGWRRPTFSVLRGLLLALPILAVFTALLASADVVFGDYVEGVLAWLNLELLVDLLSRAVVVLFVSIVSLGALAVGLQTRRDRHRSGEGRPLISPFLGYTETMVVLVLMDLLFAAFVAIQFAYLFGGEANISLRGYTYAEYARRGFSELVFTAALSLGLIYLLAQITRRQSARQVRSFNVLSAIQVGLLGVVLVSALRRLVLYEAAYGFTRLRTYTHVAIGWIGVALVVFVVLLLSDRLRRFAPAAFLGAVGFALTLALANVDAFIVARNSQRYAETEKIDVSYLLQLTDDAVPGLAALSQVVPPEDREMLLSELSCRFFRLRRWQATEPWPSAHFSRLKALQTLEAMRLQLEPYPVHPMLWGSWQRGPYVVGVGENTYWCRGGGWD